MPVSPRIVWLFDIDGTLLSTEGAAREALSLAVRDCLGVEDDLRDIAFAGRTDPLILGDILAKHGRVFSDGEASRLWAASYAHMDTLLTPGRTTGMARIKLRHFGIAGRFAFGAFGEEAVDRNELARVAVTRAAERCGVPPSRCIVVGDTEHDIACARAAGAQVVAVATGVRAREDLARHRPDLLLDDLSDPAGCLALARGLGGGP